MFLLVCDTKKRFVWKYTKSKRHACTKITFSKLFLITQFFSRRKAKLKKLTLARDSLVRFTNGETWVRAFFHKIERFFTVCLCVYGWVLANKSFRLLFFSYVWSIIILHYIASRTGDLNLATFRILTFKYLRLVFVGWYLCVYVCLWNRVLCCLFCICVGVFVRAKFWEGILIQFSPLKISTFLSGRVKWPYCAKELNVNSVPYFA